MEKELNELRELNKTFVLLKNTKTQLAQTEEDKKKCLGNKKYVCNKYEYLYNRRKKENCAKSYFSFILGSLITCLTIVAYILIMVNDVKKENEVFFSIPVDTGEIVICVILGVFVVSFVFALFAGSFLPLNEVITDKRLEKYDNEHIDEKNRAIRLDKEETDKVVKNANDILNKLNLRSEALKNTIDELEQRIKATVVLPEIYKTETAVNALLSYFEQRRVNNIQEAINLYVFEQNNERQHQELVKLQQQSNAYVRQAASAAQNAANSAAQAARTAASAADSAASAADSASSAANSAASNSYNGPSVSEIESAVNSAIRRNL